MTPRPSRTTIAALVTAVALGLPCGAWFVSGSRAARDEVERLLHAPRLEGREEAERLARAVAQRLESLRRSEERRSFLDYGAHEHAQAADCSCEPRLRSPLAEGPADPLVWTHFQIDEVGELTLPSLGTGAAIPVSEPAILEALECVAADRLAALPRPNHSSAERQVQGRDGGWVIAVGPLRWYHVALEHEPALLALREVSAPAAQLAQGFVVRGDALGDLLTGSRFPARLRSGVPESETEALVPLSGEPWTVAVDVSADRTRAATAAARVRSRFRTGFAAGLGAALLSGALVVTLVAQADRLAGQRSRFAAAAAHELRTPLAGLRLYGEMLADASGDRSRHRHYAGQIAAEAERLGRVVGNLLGLAQLERGQLGLRVMPGDLGSAVTRSVERLRPTVEAGGATVALAVAPELPQVSFDPDAVHQILQNLVDNADRHGRPAADRRIHVALDSSPAGVALAVIDHGPGVDPAMRRRLFHPAGRRAGRVAPNGLGLGLELVRVLAQAQGATVAYAEAPGGGAHFTVSFRPAGARARQLPRGAT